MNRLMYIFLTVGLAVLTNVHEVSAHQTKQLKNLTVQKKRLAILKKLAVAGSATATVILTALAYHYFAHKRTQQQSSTPKDDTPEGATTGTIKTSHIDNQAIDSSTRKPNGDLLDSSNHTKSSSDSQATGAGTGAGAGAGAGTESPERPPIDYTGLGVPEEKIMHNPCRCKFCISPPINYQQALQRKEAVDGILMDKKASLNNNASPTQWQCTVCNHQTWLFMQTHACPHCLAWRCNGNLPYSKRCDRMHYNEKTRCLSNCHASTWHCPKCKKESSQSVCESCKTDLDFKESLTWTCEWCKHKNNWRTDATCQGRIQDITGRITRRCEKPALNITVTTAIFQSTLGRSSILEEQFNLAKKKPYLFTSCFKDHYINPNNRNIILAEDLHTLRHGVVGDCFVPIDMHKYKECRGDGYCGWRACSGILTSETDRDKRTLKALKNHIRKISTEDEWLKETELIDIANLFGRQIVLMRPYGYNQDTLFYSIMTNIVPANRAQGSNPILLLASRPTVLHYDRYQLDGQEIEIFREPYTSYTLDERK